MSLNYTDKVMLAYGIVDTPSDGDIVAMIPSLTYNYLVTNFMVIVNTAGAEAATALRLETAAASPTVLGTLTIGTTAADTSLAHVVVDDNREVTAGTGMQLAAVTTDASAVYYFCVWGTTPYS